MEALPADAASPDARRSQLSLDDLSSGAPSPGASPLEDTARVEAKLQRNLAQQQAHYARQRELFEALGRDSVLGLKSDRRRDTPRAAASPTEENGEDDEEDDSPSARTAKFQLHFSQEDAGGAKKVANVEKRAVRRVSGGDETDDDELLAAIEIERLQRKAKSIASYHSRIAAGGLQYTKATSVASGAPRSRHASNSRLDESAAHYESSNEALRKQLELLRRLQLENNRFRHENRSLREQNEVLEEQSTLHTREIKRLTDEVSDLSLRVQHDQLELATAAQTARKLKQLHKQLEALQSERDQLQTALQEAGDRDAQLRLRSQNEIESVVQESKHLKRSLKQSRQHEARLQEQLEEIKGALAAAEHNGSELKRQLLDAKREHSEMVTRLSEKTTHIESIESSASQCVERMEAGMEALQKAHQGEREKRKKLEKLRDTLQSDMGTLEVAHSKLEERVCELESYNTQLQQRLQDAKLEKKQDKTFHDERLQELQERHRNDAKTIATLREECGAYEQQLEAARSSIVEIRKEVANECNALRKDVEALRNYVEDAQRLPSGGATLGGPSDDNVSSTPTSSVAAGGGLQAPPRRTQREELWVQLPELQFLQGAVGGLRNEAMNFVSDFQRARHQVRQFGAQLTSAQERVVELEHLRSEDALARNELADQRLLAEQAREITLREKMEVLAWSQQACEKSERLEAALTGCASAMQGVVKKARRSVAAVSAVLAEARHRGGEEEEDDGAAKAQHKPTPLVWSRQPDEDPETHASRLQTLVERDVQELFARVETLVDAYKASTDQCQDRAMQLTRLQKEMDAQRQDHAAVVAEIEALHARSLAEKQALFSSSLRAMEDERDALQKDLADEREALAAMQSLNEALEIKLHELEQDAPVFATVVQLFALVVPPLVLQVNDLLAQKRVLARENAEFAMAHEQVECIGQVLRELVPAGGGGGSDDFVEKQRRQRRRQFRRVVIAVFAINRLQRGGFAGSATGTGESLYGVSTSLKPAKKKKSKTAGSLSSSFGTGGAASCLPPQTMIKVLLPKPLLARLNLRELMNRLRALDLSAKLREFVEASTVDGKHATPSSFGSLLVTVLSAVDPINKDTLEEDTSGAFHCRALLERRKAARWQDGSGSGDTDHEGARQSTVDLVRKRILALGKRLEDLHYQRNALQKENYDFQYQLDQQAAQLQEMDALGAKNEELQHEIKQLRAQQERDATSQQVELAEKDRALEQRQRAMQTQHDQIAQLEKDVAMLETRISELELEKTDLHHALLVAKSASAAEEEQLHKSRVGLDRQAEELRALKQAAKRAHELHERVAWQLEQELVEKATLQATMEHLRKQKETLEREVARANVRALDESTDVEVQEEDGEHERVSKHVTVVVPRKAASGGHSGAVETSFSSSSSSYDRELQDLADRIASMRQAASAVSVHPDREIDDTDDDDRTVHDDERRVTKGTETRRAPSGQSVDAFRNEWQRLDISGVFDEEQSIRSDTTMTKPASRIETDGHDQIDKVNSAVHDYMDRIDEKLQQMYGIPKSASRSRPAPSASIVHGSRVTSTKKATEVRWGDATELE